jgi:hypothetical protein
MKRPWTMLATGLALAGVLLIAGSPGVLAGQQTFSSVSSGTPPAPLATPAGLSVSGVYFGIYQNNRPYHPYPPCYNPHCRHPLRPVPPNRPPVPSRPVPVPRPAPPRP